MNSHFAVASAVPAAVLLLFGGAAAQDQATTLLAASRAAPIVVRAVVQVATDPSPEWHRLQFARLEVLKGSVGEQFVLLEPAGACCGRSLFALRPGDACLLFLQMRGSSLHPFGGARGVLQDLPSVVSHVRSLLGAPHDAAAASLLAQNLAHEQPRVAEDAAAALAVLPHLALGAAERALVAVAMQHATQRRSTSLAALAETAVRLHDAPMLDVMLPIYLTAERDDQASLLRRALGRCSPAALTERLPMHTGLDAQRALRAAELLTTLPAADAEAALLYMLHEHGHPRVQLCLAEAWLGAGRPGEQLAAMVPAPVLLLAQRRQQQARTFRSITPNRR